jgi:hypothetical protein
MMWAIVTKPELSAVSVHDPRTDTRTDSERFRDFAKKTASMKTTQHGCA